MVHSILKNIAENFLGRSLASFFEYMDANKGVISHIIPDDLRPIAVTSDIPLDLICSVFSVFSRMNISQILEGIVAKNVKLCEQDILNNPDNSVEHMTKLNESVIKHLGDDDYYNRVSQELVKMSNDDEYRQIFIDNVLQNNLYIEAPSFSKVNIGEIYRNATNPNEPVLLKKELIKYVKQNLKLKTPFPEEDIYLDNKYCAPMYIMKLYKLVSHIISARDLGPCKYITKQPIKGRARGGASRLGQMEVEGILAHGVDDVLREFLTVKSDSVTGKNELIASLLKNGTYSLPDTTSVESGTKRVVSTFIEAIQK